MSASSSETPVRRFIVGIDLGTTNSAVGFIDTEPPGWKVETFVIPQLIAPGEIDLRETLPSFYYQAAKDEFPSGALNLPWDQISRETAVGVFAREQGKLVPGRVIESAKSWLCHPGVDRTSGLLPWQGPPDVPRLSPVEASAAYLRHLREAWNDAHPQSPLEEQDVIITLPASFDEVARELTVAAARLAGLPRVILIEEPQAAFYAWISAHPDNWSQLVEPGQNILVCDIGGGTSDFTLIRVRQQGDNPVQFHRVAVGDHLILGGDNLDLALAHHLERKLQGEKKLEPRQWGSLVRICRHAKETLLTSAAPETYSLSLPGTGSRLIGGGLSVDLDREEAQQLLLDGFFPFVTLNDHPRKKSSGFQEFGLPYAADPAVTRHLARFLENHCRAGLELDEAGSTRPDVILFNGGVFTSELIQTRIIESLQRWYQQGDPHWQPQVLENKRHDLAVARGAAYYGMVRRGTGVRIAAGLPRTYYIGIGTSSPGAEENDVQALCLMPAGAEPGTEIHLTEHTFHLTISTPVEFSLFHSSLRLTDRPGSLSPVEREQLTALPPIRTVLRSRKEKQATDVAVQLHARLTEIGTLQVWGSEVDGHRSWQLQFDIRSATQTDMAAHGGQGEAAGVLDDETLHLVQSALQDCFGPDGKEKPAGLMKRLGQILDLSREEWPPALLREIWDQLLSLEQGRKKSAEHEMRWLNLFGFALRPGYSMALDDWRVDESWKRLRSRINHPGPGTLVEWWILWRRIAGGLAAGQQQALANPIITRLREEFRKSKQGRTSSPHRAHSQEQAEAWRMLGSLERLPVNAKQDLGEIALAALDDPAAGISASALLWTIGRLGAREPFYGPLNTVIPSATAQAWLSRLMTGSSVAPERLLATMQLARRTGDRYRDLADTERQQVAKWLRKHNAPEEYLMLVEQGGELARETSALVFGESLPAGLRLLQRSG